MATPAQHDRSRPLHYRGHIAGLDLLRGIAVLSVVVCHAYSTSTDYARWRGLEEAFIAVTIVGHLGVHLFFMLSGFLITGILLDGKTARHAARSFYLRRARRILPAYLLLLIVLRLTHTVSWNFVLAGLLFVVNMGRVVGAQLAQYSIVWSLAVEEQFYLVWPWITWRCSLKTIGRVIIACLVLSPVIRLGLAVLGQDTYYKTWANLDYLMYGAVVAYTLRTGSLHTGNIRRIAFWLYTGGLVGVAAGTLIWFMAGPVLWAQALFVSIGRTQDMVIFVGLLLSAILAHDKAQDKAHDRAKDTLTAPPAAAFIAVQPSAPAAGLRALVGSALAFLGYISYGLYLVHMLIFRFYDEHVAGTVLGGFQQNFALLTLRALLCFAVSVLLAWLSRSTIEAWFLRRNQAPRPQSAAWKAVGLPGAPVAPE